MILKAQDISKSYRGRKVVNGISVEVNQGNASIARHMCVSSKSNKANFTEFSGESFVFPPLV